MSDSRVALLLFAAAFLVRAVCAMGASIFGTDGGHYLLMADWMREGRIHDALAMTYHPLYPMLTALARAGMPSTPAAGMAVSVLLGAAAIVPLFAIAKEFVGRPAAYLTGLFYAFGAALVDVQADVMTEGTYFFFFFSSMALTWRMVEAPSLERGVVLGAAAAGAFLTRPEGLLPVVLALAWPAAALLSRRNLPWRRIGGLAATAVALILLCSPYLLWVRAQRGHWAISARVSAISAERSMESATELVPASQGQGKLFASYGRAVLRVSGVLLPFVLLGAAVGLPAMGAMRAAFFLSFPLGQWGGVLMTLRTHNFMTERYLLAGMVLLSALGALGILLALRWTNRRRPLGPRELQFAAVLICLLAVLPGVRSLRVRREECRSYPLAAQWILSQPGPRPRGMSGPVEQVAYLCGSRSYYSGNSVAELDEQLRTTPIDYYVYSEKDLQSRRAYVDLLRSYPKLDAAVEIHGPDGTWTVYIHRVKRTS